MRLTITVRSYCDAPPQDRKVRNFDQFPVIIGRSNACDYNLVDAGRYISSNHATILLEAGQLVVQDTSANGVYLNGSVEPVGRGRKMAINDGDSMAIGDYTLAFSIDQHASGVAGDVAGNLSDDPFADFGSVAGQAPDPAASFDPFRGDEPDWTPPSEQSSDPFGDDWDLNDVPSTPGSGGGDWADWDEQPSDRDHKPARAPSPAPAADDFDWLPGTTDETVSIPPSVPLPPAHHQTEARRSNPSRDPFEQRSGQAAPRRAPPRVQGQQPPVRRKAPGAQLRPQSRPSPVASNKNGASIELLLRAAALKETDFAGYSDAQILEQTGRLLSQMVDAMMVLLQSRAEIKNAIRSDVTSLARTDNNPLKFSFSAADALTKLLSEQGKGYMPSDTAINEAVDDLKLHQIAMLDGMKAAVRSLLLEFDPVKLAGKLEKSGGISANIPITREAKLWEMFCEQYDAIREEAVNDFGELFGAEFRKAYDKRNRKKGRDPDF